MGRWRAVRLPIEDAQFIDILLCPLFHAAKKFILLLIASELVEAVERSFAYKKLDNSDSAYSATISASSALALNNQLLLSLMRIKTETILRS